MTANPEKLVDSLVAILTEAYKSNENVVGVCKAHDSEGPHVVVTRLPGTAKLDLPTVFASVRVFQVAETAPVAGG
jgi:hypothetical protein